MAHTIDGRPVIYDPRSRRLRNAEDTILDLHAEIERLRAVLVEIRDSSETFGGAVCKAIATRALEQKVT
jgi:hypothetical protein